MAESRLILGARRCREDKGTRDLEDHVYLPKLEHKLGDQESDLI
jgi:hypothetical protein